MTTATMQHRTAVSTSQPQAQKLQDDYEDRALFVRAILSNFWTDADPKVQAVEVGSWCKTLTGVLLQELQAAWDKYQECGPRNGRGKLEKPTAFDLRAKIDYARQQDGRARRPEAAKALPPPASESELTEEELFERRTNAQRIMANAGFNVRRAMVLRKVLTARSMEEAERIFAQPQKPHWTETEAPDSPKMAAFHSERDSNPLVQAARAAAEHALAEGPDLDEPDREVAP